MVLMTPKVKDGAMVLVSVVAANAALATGIGPVKYDVLTALSTATSPIVGIIVGIAGGLAGLALLYDRFFG